MKRFLIRSIGAICAPSILLLGQSFWASAAAKDLKWCSDVTVTGTIGRSIYEAHNGLKHPIEFMDLNEASRVLPAGGDCDFDKVVTDRIQLAGHYSKPETGQPLTVTGRLLPQGAPADRYEVILFVPKQR